MSQAAGTWGKIYFSFQGERVWRKLSKIKAIIISQPGAKTDTKVFISSLTLWLNLFFLLPIICPTLVVRQNSTNLSLKSEKIKSMHIHNNRTISYPTHFIIPFRAW